MHLIPFSDFICTLSPYAVSRALWPIRLVPSPRFNDRTRPTFMLNNGSFSSRLHPGFLVFSIVEGYKWDGINGAEE